MSRPNIPSWPTSTFTQNGNQQMAQQLLSPISPSPSTPPGDRNLGFRYVWPVKVTTRQLGENEAAILHISPKFATVYDHVSFQWTLKMHGTAYVAGEDGDEDDEGTETGAEIEEESTRDYDYVAISLYYVDGPVNTVELKAKVRIAGEKGAQGELKERKTIIATRGRECEIGFTDREHLTTYIKEHLGNVIRLSLQLEMDSSLFNTDAYLNAVSPTPIHSFLTANYKARVSSKVWKRKPRQSIKRPRSKSDGQPNCKKLDLERAFNRVMEQEREQRRLRAEAEEAENLIRKGEEPEGEKRDIPSLLVNDVSTDEAPVDSSRCSSPQIPAPLYSQHLFKKLLVACCDSCERRASLIVPSLGSGDDEDDCSSKDEENSAPLKKKDNASDFADFLIDAELNDLPVLKRACERYLCGELNTKQDLMTSLLLNLLFLAMVFQLPVMKSMTMTELCNRHHEIETVDKLLEQEEYRDLDKRIRKMCDRNLAELVDEIRRFREQKLRVHPVNLN
ncbi:hypothetical protein Ddc_19988 [Ditylenchus destructor]|nr:hypothetical protein Ddc_19988 [Ditylenchus destructor]